MTIQFHRLVAPTYFISGATELPPNYDMLNTPSDPSVGGSGSPAPAAGKKAGGPNDGTYFAGFGDDATASNMNRAAQALGLNTDYLDTVQRTSIPRLIFTDATAGGTISTVALTGEIFVGESGMSDTQANRDLVVHITDQTDNDLEVSGTKVVATKVHNGSGTSVLGTIADGFRTNASVDVSPAIPSGTNYRIWYGVRSSVNDISQLNKGAYFEHQIRAVEHVPGVLRSLFRQIHSEASVNQAYDAAFDSTIRSLASSGLNERYRRSTTQPAGFVTGNYNTPGGGAIITRDGQAVTVSLPLTDVHGGGQFPDSQLAGYRAVSAQSRAIQSVLNLGKGGDIGYIHESDSVVQSFTAESVRDATAGPALVEIVPRDIRDSLSSSVFTFINPGSTATLNPTAGSTNLAVSTIQCATGQYFRQGGKTSLRMNVDMLEVVWGGRPPETYIITNIQSDTRVQVIGLAGAIPVFPPNVTTNCTIRWLQVTASLGGIGLAKGNEISGFAPYTNRRFLYLQPAPLSTSYASTTAPNAAGFFAGSEEHSLNLELGTAMVWGQVNPTDGIPTVKGRLLGDGSITAVASTLSGAITAASAAISGNATVGGTLGVTGAATFGSTLAAGDITVGNVNGANLFITSDGHFGNQCEASFFTADNPEVYATIEDEFYVTRVDTTNGVLQTMQNNWWLDNITGGFTFDLSVASTSKHPGKFKVDAAGGGVHRQLGIMSSQGFPFAFGGLDIFKCIVSVTDAGGNVYASINVGFSDAVGLGNNNLSIAYIHGSGWVLLHMKGGSPGTHHLASLGTQVNGQFATFRFAFVTSPSVGMGIFFNETLILVVANADLPTSLMALLLFYEQTVGDAGATSWVVDYVYSRFFVDDLSGRSP